MTLVLGVQQDSTTEMVELARFAERLDPDMMIAMPPKVGSSLADYRAYYGALARTTERPVMIQTQPNLPGVAQPAKRLDTHRQGVQAHKKAAPVAVFAGRVASGKRCQLDFHTAIL